MNDNKRLVYIVWRLDTDVNEWYPVAACEDEYEAETYVGEHEDNYDVTMMFTSAYVPAPLAEEAG